MKKLGTLLLGMLACMPVYAQDEAAAAPAAEEAAPADAAPADAVPAEAAPADAAPATDAAAADTSAPAEEAAPADATADAVPAADAAAPADATASTEPAADATTSESAPAADAAAASDGSAPTDGSAPAESTADASAEAAPAEAAADASAETASTETPAETPTEETPAEETPVEERTPWQLYAGYDYAMANFLSSTPDSPGTPSETTQFSTDNLHGKFHQLRAGVRVFDVVGIEAHYGMKGSSEDKPDSMGVKNTMGVYIVPTGTLFDVVEISALIGYARTKLEHDGKSLTLNGSSYGANMEVPLRPLLGEWMPDIRLGGGILMIHHDRDSRVYSTHVGLRYDFKV